MCPIIWLYRQALELRLKELVGGGSSFLKSGTDPISLYRTHSLRWLAQIVCEVIRTLGWEHDFTCEGVSNLAEFSFLINEFESLDPVLYAVHFEGGCDHGSMVQTSQKINAARFAEKFDALLELLDVTADAWRRLGINELRSTTTSAQAILGREFTEGAAGGIELR